MTVTTESEVRISTASAIDLAGSEDNRRTENGKERMVESASINKSLFVLAKCVEAISSESNRVPYRESKMTRILSLGQNNGMTVMILNLAPVRSYHSDTLSSLNFANRTKKIEVREVENEPIFKGCSRAGTTFTGLSIQRQPLRPLATDLHSNSINTLNHPSKPGDKQTKSFSVYSDQSQQPNKTARPARTNAPKFSPPRKRPSDSIASSMPPHPKRRSSGRLQHNLHLSMSKRVIEDMIEKKVNDLLGARALDQHATAPQPAISEEVQRRLDLLEQRIDGKDDEREQGLSFLLMAKQHVVRGENASALRMFTMAKDFFPDNKKLDSKIDKLKEKINAKREVDQRKETNTLMHPMSRPQPSLSGAKERKDADEEEYHEEEASSPDYESDARFKYKAKPKKLKFKAARSPSSKLEIEKGIETPRTKQLLEIVNTRDVSRIRLLKGIGPKRAEAIVEALCAGEQHDGESAVIHDLRQLGQLKGIGPRLVENWRADLPGMVPSG